MDLPSAVAAPLYIELDGRDLWFTPLKLWDLGVYEAWAVSTYKGSRQEVLEQADASIEGFVLLLWLSLRHLHPGMQRVTLIKLLAKDGIVNILKEKVIPHIMGNSFTFTQQTTQASRITDEDTDWTWVFQGLAELYNFTIAEVAAMSMDQVTMYLSSTEGGKSKRIVKFDSLAEATQYIQKLKQDGQNASNN